jgi:hypothetical protein
MKKFWAVIVILAVAIGIYFFEKKNSAPENSITPTNSVAENNSNATNPTAPNNSQSVPANSSANASASVSATAPTDLASRAASPNPVPALASATNETQNLPPTTVLDHARVAVHNYNSMFGENPVGTNPEITAALMGKNPRQANFITPESGLRVNENGEMVDAYGTPFFFHQLSGQEMEIRSAGEDRKMWTFDDLVTR